MLADSFPPRRLGLAVGVYYAGIPLGLATALISSSIIAPRYGWRFSFYALGLIGLVATGLLFFFREPARRRVADTTKQKPAFTPVYCCGGCHERFRADVLHCSSDGAGR
jgi:MFS family permease